MFETECDISVLKLRFRNFSNFLGGIGFGIEKIWYRKKFRIRYRKKFGIKKYRIRYRKKFGIEKSIGFGIGKNLVSKKVSELV